MASNEHVFRSNASRTEPQTSCNHPIRCQLQRFPYAYGLDVTVPHVNNMFGSCSVIKRFHGVQLQILDNVWASAPITIMQGSANHIVRNTGVPLPDILQRSL